MNKISKSSKFITVLNMKLTRCNPSLNVNNLEDSFCQKVNLPRHGKLLPSSIRCLIIGPSNCGKTNLMISLLEDSNGLRFKNVYIYSKSLQQPKYMYLKKLLTSIKGLGYFEYSENTEIIEPEEAKEHSVFIFDDVACCNQQVIRKYFSMGRHNFIDSFYLCQSYTRIPKHLVRDNANMLVIFKQDDLNLRHIYDDHIGVDMSFKTFKEMCGKCWSDPYGFLVINKDKNINNGRYNKQFNHHIILKN